MDELIEELTKRLFVELEASGRHVHLTKEAALALFGHPLTPLKGLSQPGQFAARERVSLITPKGRIDKVAVLGPERKRCQVELSRTDCVTLGLKAPTRDSGDTDNSPAMGELKKTIKHIAFSKSNVLILGESGTGKELVAHAIHSEYYGENKPFVCVNCAAIPSELLESELFGYEEGSFTGAKKGGKIGMFQAADGGTLFLDEIGEMPLQMQAKLLRVLQDKKVKKVGSNEAKPVNVRIIAATNRDLEAMVKEGTFRDDLYFRLNVISVNIPPLRERVEDLPMLVDVLIDKVSGNPYMDAKGISPEAMEYIKKYPWPGNVRELENVIEHAANFVGSDGIIHVNNLPKVVTGLEKSSEIKTLKQIVDEIERQTIVNALHNNNGSRVKAAKALGISRTSLYEKMEKHNIAVE